MNIYARNYSKPHIRKIIELCDNADQTAWYYGWTCSYVPQIHNLKKDSVKLILNNTCVSINNTLGEERVCKHSVDLNNRRERKKGTLFGVWFAI